MPLESYVEYRQSSYCLAKVPSGHQNRRRNKTLETLTGWMGGQDEQKELNSMVEMKLELRYSYTQETSLWMRLHSPDR